MRRRGRPIAVGLLLGLVGVAPDVAAQRAPSLPDLPLGQAFPEARVTDQARLLSERNASLLIDGPVDPETYILGPGDLVGIEILAAYSISAEDVVGADGSVTFPQLGTFWVADRTLAEVRREVGEKSRSVVRGDVEPAFLLKSPRTFKVHVIGSVQVPGSQSATPMTRVSEVVQEAGGFAVLGDTRNVRITHRDSTETSADLLAFLLAGDLSGNPRLRDGDVVTVSPRGDDLRFTGALLHPGSYDFVEGDELGTLLAVIGLHPRADRSRAILQRFQDGAHWDTVSVELEPVLDGTVQVPLRPGDRILIRAQGDWRTGSTVEVRGAVAYPGPVPVQRGQVTAAQAIEMAGGYLSDAVRSRVVLAKPFLPDSSGIPDPIGSESYLSAVSASRIHERIVDLSEGTGPILEPGDILHVPRTEPWVQVLGQVKNPGFYVHYDDWKVVDYIRAAGGYGKYADRGKVQVSRGRFGDVGYADDVKTLSPGDLVWVPEKRVQGFWATFRDVIAAAGQAAALVLVAREITQ